MTKVLSVAAVAVVLLSLAGCGASESSVASGSEIPAGTSATAAAEQPASDRAEAGPIDFSEADLDLYERAFVKEVELVRAAGERARNAATPAERGEAMQAQWDDHSIPAASKAAGVPEERYRHTRGAVHEVFKTLDFQGKIDGPMSIDLSRVSGEMKAKLEKDPFDTLTPSAAAALRARMDRLVPVWIDYVRMTAVAG